MRHRHYALFLLTALVAILLLVSACDLPGSGTSSSPPQSKLTVMQVLQNSQKAMSQLKSAHVNLQISGSGRSSGSVNPTTGTPTAGRTLNFSLTGHGDEALPAQEEMTISATQTATNSSYAVTEILSGGKLYAQFLGQWYLLNAGPAGVAHPLGGLSSPDMSQLLGLLSHVQIVDHGDQLLNGTSLRHITFKLDKYALQQLLDSNSQLVSAIGQSNIDAVINNTQTFNASLDLWIDETQFYVHRTELKLNLNINPAGIGQSITPTAGATIPGPLPSSVLTNLDSIVVLSKFNEPVTITPPVSATPVTIPTTVPTP